ncbi:MAG: site-specific DNA-methyltransferase [Firmicutes bacterium]|nr:site-specific DNA-methyltransferase [Bacillota bacterium]
MDKKKRINLDGRTWTRYSISVWNDIQKSSVERRLKHPALFPVALVERLLEIYAHPGEMILDPFLGSGSTLIGAQRLGMKGLGLDISEDYIKLFEKRLSDEKIDTPTVKAINEDARKLQKYVEPFSLDLCITSPPYWDILREKRTADLKSRRHYGDNVDDLGNIEDYDLFLEELKTIFAGVYAALKKGRHCIVVVMDIRKRSKFYPLHMDLCRQLVSLGFLLDDIIIWDRRLEYNNLRPLGFPYVFRVNKVHEYIMIFQKPS